MTQRNYPPDSVEAAIRQHGNPIYGSDPDLPGFLVRENADGSRERGVLIGRRFYSLGAYREVGDLESGGVPLTLSLQQMKLRDEDIVWAVFDALAKLWKLTDAERGTLVGTKPEGDVPLTQAQFERFAELLGIYEALHNLYQYDSQQPEYLRRRHVGGTLKDHTPLEIMLATNDGPRQVATFLLSAAQGWN
jgi:hypothetical protein